MKISEATFQKTLLYNLIIFNFILLESSTKKISNFFIENLSSLSLKKNYSRISLAELVSSFKRFLRSLYFLKKHKKKSLILMYGSELAVELLKLFFRKNKLDCFIGFNFKRKSSSSFFSKKLIFLEYPVTQSAILSFFFSKFFLFQAINSFDDAKHFSLYKIFSTLDDQKKLLFFGLIIASIFKQ